MILSMGSYTHRRLTQDLARLNRTSKDWRIQVASSHLFTFCQKLSNKSDIDDYHYNLYLRYLTCNVHHSFTLFLQNYTTSIPTSFLHTFDVCGGEGQYILY